jgi:rare lipoprotein A
MTRLFHLLLTFRTFQLLAISSVLVLTACSSSPKVTPKSAPKTSVTKTDSNSGAVEKPANVSSSPSRGGYYQDDGPGESIPANLEKTPDPVPTVEPYSCTGNKPYQVFGKTYTPLNDNTTPFKQRGIASWYGKKFHGKRTSSGEPYDMFKITAAHPILPIPSFARVTNLSNGKQIIVRINDRGPFHSNRVMDLSYTAALKLGYIGKGSSEIEIERLLPDDIARMAENRKSQIVQTEQSAADNTLAADKALERERQAAADKAKVETPANTKITEKSIVGNDNTSSAGTMSTQGKTNEGGAAFYLQFAAFGIRANADMSREQIQQKIRDQIGSLDLVFEIVQQGNLYRLQAGPFANRLDAQTMLEKLSTAVAKPIIVQR